MQNLIFCLNAVVPSFIIMAVGFLVSHLGLIDTPSLKQFNRVCLYTMMPLTLFRIIRVSDFSKDFNILMTVIVIGSLFAAMAVMALIAPHMTQRRGSIGSMIQAAYRSNIIVMALPIATNLCGEENIGPTAVLITMIGPLFNIMAIVGFSFYNDKERKKITPVSLIIDIFKNPIIIAALVAVVLNIFDITLPEVIERPINSLADATSPVAVLVAGALLNLKNAAKNIRLSATAVFSKLIAMPLFGTLIAIACGLRGAVLCGVFTILAAPCATGCASLADALDGDGALAAETVALSTVLSAFTIFIGSFTLKSLGLI